MILDKIFKDGLTRIFDCMSKNDKHEYIYALAEAHAIDLIASTISQLEIQTFEEDSKSKKIKEKKGDLYWLLNIQPNQNENGTSFIYKLVSKLLVDGKALIVINKNKKEKFLYVAETYDASEDILYGKTFSNVRILDEEGNSILLKKTYNKNNSIYMTLNNEELKSAKTDFKKYSEKMIKAAQISYKSSNVPKWWLQHPGTPYAMRSPDGKPISYSEYKEKITDGLTSDDESVLMLSEQFKLTNLNEKVNKKGIEDYEKIKEDVSNEVANDWKIPLDIFKGNSDKNSNSHGDFITLAIKPYVEVITDALIASLVGKEDYQKGEYIKFNIINIFHKDILDSASGIDKLIANGFSFNQVQNILGLPKIDDDWANEHHITKNYTNVKGGGTDE